ncbi:MAG: tetratricopeptide repeat protein [Planctomycetes bacterium]|nr:tetratricopeptide repeat protein [Planctomycetota bacterium]
MTMGLRTAAGRLAASPRRVALVLALVSAAAHGNAIPGEFVFDDVRTVQENAILWEGEAVPSILGGVLGGVPLAERGDTLDTSYRPLRFLSFRLDADLTRLLFGGRRVPYLFHATNVALHAMAALLVYLLALRLTGAGEALAAALLFALHPGATESVAYISGRRDVLSTALYLGGAVAYLGPAAPAGGVARGPWGAALALGAYVLAISAKEMALTLPAACLALDLALARRPRWATLGLMAAVAVPVGLWTVLAANPAGTGAEGVGWWGGSPYHALLGAARAAWFHVGRLLWPVGLAADLSFDGFPASRGLWDPPGGAVALAGWGLAVALAAAAAARGGRLVPLSVALYLLTLLPVSQLVPHPERVAEHHGYLPSVWVFLPLGAAFLRGGVPGAWALAAVLALLGARTAVRNLDWRDSRALWTSAAAAAPRSARARWALGMVLRSSGEMEAALTELDAALEILSPEARTGRLAALYLSARHARGEVRFALGDAGGAARDFRALLDGTDAFGRPVADQPRFAHLWHNYASCLRGLGDEDGSVQAWRRAAELAPGYGDPRVFLGEYHLRRGELAQARGWLEAVRGEDPQYPIALLSLGKVHEASGDAARAALCYEGLAGRRPGSADARYLLARARHGLGRPAAEREALEAALRLDPGHAAARFSLGGLLATSGELEAARGCFEAVLAAEPDHDPSRAELVGLALRFLDRGRARLDGGQAEGALADAEAALSLGAPGHSAGFLRGLALGALGRGAEAEGTFRGLALRAGEGPAAASAWMALSDLLRGREAWDEAGAALEAALRAGAGAEAVLNLGNVRARSGRMDEARSAFRDYLRLAPAGEAAEAVRRWLETHP